MEKVNLTKSVINLRHRRLHLLRNRDCSFDIVFVFDRYIEERQNAIIPKIIDYSILPNYRFGG